MQPLDLNLATRPFRNNTPLWVGFGLAVSAVVAFTTWNVSTFLDQRSRLAELDGRLAGAETTIAQLTGREAVASAAIRELDVKNLSIQTARANQFLLRRGLSWTRLFNLLEDVQPPEIRMTAIRPIFSRETRSSTSANDLPEGVVPISVEGVAKDLDAFLEFERQLLQDAHFARVEPQRADRVRNSAEILFDIRFFYDPQSRLGSPGVKLPPVLAAQAEAEESGPAKAPAAGDGETP